MKIFRDGREVEKMRPEDEVELGVFPQTKEGKSLPIRWVVGALWGNLEYSGADKEEEKTAVLISKDCLEAMPYAESGKHAVWETSLVRHWLNKDFYHRAFTEREKSRIICRKTPNIHHTYHPHYRTSEVTYTNDSVIIPYSSVPTPKDWECAKATAYCRNKLPLYDRIQSHVRYWRLTSDLEETVADYTNAEGKYQFNKGYFGENDNDGIDGAPVDTVFGIRPVIYIRLQEKEIDYEYEKEMYFKEVERTRELCGGIH